MHHPNRDNDNAVLETRVAGTNGSDPGGKAQITC